MAAEDLDRGPLREDRRWRGNYSSCLRGWRSAASASCGGETQTGFQLCEEAVGLEHAPLLARVAACSSAEEHKPCQVGAVLPEMITDKVPQEQKHRFSHHFWLSRSSNSSLGFSIHTYSYEKSNARARSRCPSWETGEGRKTGLIEEEKEGSQSCKKLKSLLETLVWFQTGPELSCSVISSRFCDSRQKSDCRRSAWLAVARSQEVQTSLKPSQTPNTPSLILQFANSSAERQRGFIYFCSVVFALGS